MSAVPKQESAIAIGAPFEGGFFSGVSSVNAKPFALIVAPKAAIKLPQAALFTSRQKVPPAHSYDDGMANTLMLAEAGSKQAIAVRELVIDGFNDWYIPSQDELELLYRHFKPTTEKNWCYARSGINLSAIPPTRPYTPDFPPQTTLNAFRTGGAEAFEAAYYQSSTIHISATNSAWYQRFDNGTQYGCNVSYELLCSPVRRSFL